MEDTWPWRSDAGLVGPGSRKRAIAVWRRLCCEFKFKVGLDGTEDSVGFKLHGFHHGTASIEAA